MQSLSGEEHSVSPWDFFSFKGIVHGLIVSRRPVAGDVASRYKHTAEEPQRLRDDLGCCNREVWRIKDCEQLESTTSQSKSITKRRLVMFKNI